MYTAYVRGEGSPLAELEVQYADYAMWQREWLQGERLESQLSYWRRQLWGMAGALELPTDRARPPVPSHRGGLLTFSLPLELSGELNELSRRSGVTLYMVLLAGFQLLLGRWSGQRDVAVGSPIAGRRQRETESLIGFFVNTLVMRTDLSGNPTVRELLGRVREVTLGAYAHQDLPFEKLVAELDPVRDLSRSPLFQVMFILQNQPVGTSEWPGLKVELPGLDRISSTANPGSTAKFDLSVDFFETGEGLWGRMEYATDLFEGSTIQRLVDSYQTVLEGMVADVERRIEEIPLLQAGEREQILYEWNETAAELPEGKSVVDLFEEQVARTPEEAAVIFEGTELSYGELNRRANQLGHHLRELGVGPEVVVGVCLERSAEVVVAMLGIWKAGGVYLPLDPGNPGERLGYMLEDAGVEVLLTETAVAGQLPAHEVQEVWMDEDRGVIGQREEREPERKVSGENLAYVIYTSGSTGRPKGWGRRSEGW